MNVIGALGMVSILQSARQENGRYRDLACRPVLQNGGRHRRFFLLVQLGFSFSGGSEIVYGGWLQNRQRDVVLGIQIPSPCWGPLKKKKKKKTPKGKSNLIQANAIWLLATAVCLCATSHSGAPSNQNQLPSILSIPVNDIPTHLPLVFSNLSPSSYLSTSSRSPPALLVLSDWLYRPLSTDPSVLHFFSTHAPTQVSPCGSLKERTHYLQFVSISCADSAIIL
jgi:hypothetical protein